MLFKCSLVNQKKNAIFNNVYNKCYSLSIMFIACNSEVEILYYMNSQIIVIDVEFARIKSVLGKRVEYELKGARLAIEQNNELVNKLREAAVILKVGDLMERKTFADAVRALISDARAIITCKGKQNSEKTKAMLGKNVASKTINVCNVRCRNNGFLAIDCETKEKRYNDKAVIEVFMPKDYGAHISPKLHLKFKMADMNIKYQLTDDELIDELHCQNPALKESPPGIVRSHEVTRYGKCIIMYVTKYYYDDYCCRYYY
uniref:Uncharacterized protein n=1 Tax=Glossina austeni TaxID=7395 RepID=A0A1A9V2P9_GLOAU